MARPKAKNVGLIGLGIIGSRVAASLRKRGFQVFVWNRTPRLEQNFVGSPAEVAEICNIIQIFVSDDAALLDIVRLLSPALTAHHVVTAHCTVAPQTMQAAAQLVERRGARFLEAPFTGSKVAAENGQLVYYIGGDELALKQARPVLEASSKEIMLIGEIGSASTIKVATNIVTAAAVQIAAEALAIAQRSGISGETFSRAMKSNASNSTTLEMKVPMMLAGDFEPHFSVKHMLKDVRIASKLARQHGLDVPVTEAAGDMLLAEMKRGRGDADYSSVAQKYFPVSSQPVVEQTAAPANVEVRESFFIIHEPEPRPPEAKLEAETQKEVRLEEAKPEELKSSEIGAGPAIRPPETKLDIEKPDEVRLVEAKPEALESSEVAVAASADETNPEETVSPEIRLEETQQSEAKPEIPKPEETVLAEPTRVETELASSKAEQRTPKGAIVIQIGSSETTTPSESAATEQLAGATKAKEAQPPEEEPVAVLSEAGTTTETKPEKAEGDEDDLRPPPNLSGGLRGWLSRFRR